MRIGSIAWAAVGLAVHCAVMACMAAFIASPRDFPFPTRHPVLWGPAYGAALWILMYWVVKPLRWPEEPLPRSLYGVANALFSRCLPVGLPIALAAAGAGGGRMVVARPRGI